MLKFRILFSKLNQQKRRKRDKDDHWQDSCIEELSIDIGQFPALHDYCQMLREMQESHVDEVAQHGRYLSKLLKWSVVDSKVFRMPQTLPTISRPAVNLDNICVVLTEDPGHHFSHTISILERLVAEGRVGKVVVGFQVLLKKWLGLQDNSADHIVHTPTALSVIMSVALYNPFPCRGPGSPPSERHVAAQHHHLLPGNGRHGSARSDFAAVVLNERQQQLPFFIVEFQQDGFSVHKDYAVVVCEAVFEMNRILTMACLSSDEVTAITMHVALVNDTSISLGMIRPVYNEARTALLYSYSKDVANFELRSGYPADDIKNALDL
ncbi:6818_t:CDS:2, partial [Paraglomus occultum]